MGWLHGYQPSQPVGAPQHVDVAAGNGWRWLGASDSTGKTLE